MSEQEVISSEQLDSVVNVLFLSYGLACKQLAENSNLTAAQWSARLKVQAKDILTSDEYTSGDIEKILRELFPNA